MPGGYHSRHGWSRRSHAPGLKYSTATWQEYERTSLPPPDPTDEARLQGLQERDSDTWSQQDAALYEEMTDRNEQREEAKLAPLRRELEGYFADFNLPPLPPPLAKSSGWLEIRRPCYYKNEDVR
ncbi:hypothetical protein K458DRAFT_421851 [Lentithecium fluviatile CBS 122367]|uniref:Uncharacterized protein n=1 Tax=Lentithecium fluviatile CBS 122367 TaxID=1168545 RepID=A0A6G1IQ88_9PLEO|nr:hypothetical protein K458DRAFT_421851 [Lentithecium fluviatile CBS 122367]